MRHQPIVVLENLIINKVGVNPVWKLHIYKFPSGSNNKNTVEIALGWDPGGLNRGRLCEMEEISRR
jgi:hypothetical protein